jgi:simple sugar transport system ATP-binding protein
MKVGTVDTAEVTERDLARMMVGHEIATVQRPSSNIGGKILEIRDLWVRDDRGIDAVKGVSLELHEGEILGIAGVQGNGQLELAEAVAGIRRIERGAIFLNGRDITNLPARLRYREGLAYIPDSRSVGLIAEMNLTENSVLTSLSEFISKGRIEWSSAARRTSKVVERFNVVTPSLRAAVRYLSGGNQQRLLVGREMIKEPRVLVIAEPTHGLDVAATDFIRKILLDFRDKGKAILLISTDLDEIFQLSDRIAVMYEGRVVGIGGNEEFSPERIGLLMGGVHAQGIPS